MNTAAEQIRSEIAQGGAIPFARFMELALYCPVYGYYEKKGDTPGRRGDYFTSVSVGSLFGELLAFQFAEWLEGLEIADCRPGLRWKLRRGKLPIVEAGAHDGRLAKDILGWLRARRTERFERVEYWIVEPSATRRAWQEATLGEFRGRVRWFVDFGALAGDGRRQSVDGIIFSNELLDAMPVHRLGWDAKRREWFEWGVMCSGEEFVWTRLPGESAIGNRQSAIRNLPSALLEVLPDGFTTEICPAAENWWRDAAGALGRGKLLTLDYGLNAGEFFSPPRANGTLRAYCQHRPSAKVLGGSREQDLTAQVNFTAMQQVGEAAGLKTELVSSQAQFLTGIAERAWREGSDFGAWTSARTRQFQTLTHPDHLGRSFRVLVQSR